jgi:hypothetical protein
VPNPSFEDTVYCPWGTNQLDACANWLNFGNSPDYFNTCTGFGGPPLNYNFGFQYPHSGNAMAGIVIYRNPNSPNGPNYREFIGNKLSSNLIIGSKYYFSFFTNFSYILNTAIASNNIGMKFSTTTYDSCCPPPLNNFSMIYSDSILKDSILWVKISGSFIADSAYSHVIIGNFFTDQNTDTFKLGIFPDVGYYYIDDVCVSSDSIYNQVWTGFNDNFSELPVWRIFPNPAKTMVNVTSSESFSKIEIYDITGTIKFQKDFNQLNTVQIVIPESLKSGIYLIKLVRPGRILSKVFIIEH